MPALCSTGLLITKGRATHFSACKLGGGGGGGGGVGVDQHFSAHGTETGQALSFIPHRAAPAGRWQAASDWREGVGELRARNSS